jgi:biopolymer transport protein ExbD
MESAKFSTRGHYLFRNPGLAMPFVAFVVNLLVLCLLLVELRALRSSLRVSLQTAGAVPVSMAPGVAVIALGPGTDVRLNGVPLVSVNDIEFRVSGLPRQGTGITVRVAPGADSRTVVRVLQACARAGFTSVALESPASQTPGKPRE